MSTGTKRKSNDSDNFAEAGGNSGAAQLKPRETSTSVTSKGVLQGGNGNSGGVCANASTDELGGHADVTGSCTVLPHRSSSSSAALSMSAMNGECGGSGENNTGSEEDLMNCLLRASAGGGVEHAGLAARRKRRSYVPDVDAARERTASPVCFSPTPGSGELGPRSAGRRRSLPTPRLTVRDVAESGLTSRRPSTADVAQVAQSAASSGLLQSLCGDSGLELMTARAGGRDDVRLSDIDEHVSTTSSTSAAAPDATSLTADNFTTIRSADSPIDADPIIENRETLGNTVDERKSVEDSPSSSGVEDSKTVDAAVQQSVSGTTDGSSTDWIMRQTRSSAEVDVTDTWSSKWLPRRSQSLRLYRYRDRSAARWESETQQLDSNVHEFQTRAAPEREALRNRLRKLSLIYASSADCDETSRTWPASRRAPCEDGTAVPPGISPLQQRCTNKDADVSASSSSTSTLQLKYDTDSLSSQKDEGFETASISGSDVYLSSSQRSSMCDCDAALMTLERRTDQTTTKTPDNISQLELETLPPPPASFLTGPDTVNGDTPCCSGENSAVSQSLESLVVLPARGEVESVEVDAVQQHPSSDVSLSAVDEKKLSGTNAQSSCSGSPNSAKNVGTQKVVSQSVGVPARQTKVAAKPAAPAAPRRGSSLVASSSASRNSAATPRAAAPATNNPHPRASTTASTKQTVRPPSEAVPPRSTSVAFQRSSSQRVVADERKVRAPQCSRAVPPQTSSGTAFVRQSQTRATIAAPVLRTNKRAAAEARKLKAAAAMTSAASNMVSTTATHTTISSPSCRTTTTTTTSTSTSVVLRPSQRGRYRTSSSGSFTSTTSAAAAPKLTSFRLTTASSRQTSASVNVPSASTKKPPDPRTLALASSSKSSSLKTPSNVRPSTQPPNSRLRLPAAVTKKQPK